MNVRRYTNVEGVDEFLYGTLINPLLVWLNQSDGNVRGIPPV
jgi:hypothetical protein